jgi:hypothetical protein
MEAISFLRGVPAEEALEQVSRAIVIRQTFQFG